MNRGATAEDKMGRALLAALAAVVIGTILIAWGTLALVGLL